MDDPSPQVHALVQHMDLVDVTFQELSVRREVGVQRADPPVFQLQVDVERDPTASEEPYRQVAFNLRVHLVMEDSELVVEPRAIYRAPLDQAHLLTPRCLVEFANHVAVMTLLPFAREAISDLSLRALDERVLMPVFSRGHIHFELPPDDEATQH